MGARDRLRDPAKPILARSSDDVPLPLSERARERHRDLAELESLKALVLQQPDRLANVVRPPFTFQANKDPDQRNGRRLNEDGNLTNMQMPPFMRNSNANPLTIANWQYQLLMQWASSLARREAAAPAMPPPGPLSARAARRQRDVMARLGLR